MTRARASLGFDRPAGARGFLPLVLGAIAAGNAIYKAVNANQQKQRNKGYISDAYRSAVQRQQVKEGDVRQNTAESLNARGLGRAGAVRPVASRIAQAMGAQSGGIAASHSLGERAQNENSREFALERYDLEKAKDQALRENKANALDAQINAVANGALQIGQAYQLSQMGQTSAPPPPPTPSPDEQLAQISARGVPGVQVTPSRIGSAMGLENKGNWFAGVHPILPFDHPESNWAKQTINGRGQDNSEFHL